MKDRGGVNAKPLVGISVTGAGNWELAGTLTLHFLLILVLLQICQSDLRCRRIGNRQVIVVACLGLLEAHLTGDQWTTLHLVWGAGLCAVLAFIWRLGIMGGGDVKLIAACLLWVDPANMLTLIFLISALGSAVGMAVFACSRALRGEQRHAEARHCNHPVCGLCNVLGGGIAGQDLTVPYALAIAPALAITLAFTAN